MCACHMLVNYSLDITPMHHLFPLVSLVDNKQQDVCCIVSNLINIYRQTWPQALGNSLDLRMFAVLICYICRATTRPPRPSSTAECLRLIARLREEQASTASWEPRPPFEVAEMD